MKCHGFSYLYIAAACMAALLFLPGCKSAKLSDANEAFDRGEYFDAQKIYRKVYNRLTKREDVRCAEKWPLNSGNATQN